eukprot:1142377-Pelagomonas_calceolata.AAC.6
MRCIMRCIMTAAPWPCPGQGSSACKSLPWACVLYLPPLLLALQVALVTSNIEVTAADGNITRGEGGEAFGCHVVVDGNGYASLSHVTIR